jgi:hypothetical protein
MRTTQFRWQVCSGFTVHDVMREVLEGMRSTLQNTDDIQVRPRKDWKPVRITITVEREKK